MVSIDAATALARVDERIGEAIQTWERTQLPIREHLSSIDAMLEAAVRSSYIGQGLIAVTASSSPIVLSCPHGALEEVEGYRPRPRSSPADHLTRYITHRAMLLLQSRGSTPPSSISLRVHRKYVEVNTPPELACHDPRLQQAYHAYYAQLGPLLEHAATIGGSAFLLDVHGFDPEVTAVTRPTSSRTILEHDIIFGTANRATVKGTALDIRLGQLFLHEGFRAYVPVSCHRDGEVYDGGRIVRSVIDQPHPAVAVQIEINMRHRVTYEAANAFAERFSRVLEGLDAELRQGAASPYGSRQSPAFDGIPPPPPPAAR